MEKISQATLHNNLAKLYHARNANGQSIELIMTVDRGDYTERENLFAEMVQTLNEEAEYLIMAVSALFSLAAKAGAVSAERMGELIKTDPAVILSFSDEVEPAEQFDPRSIA